MMVSKEQIRDRYQAGTMGYASCISYLRRECGMSEAAADTWLLGK